MTEIDDHDNADRVDEGNRGDVGVRVRRYGGYTVGTWSEEEKKSGPGKPRHDARARGGLWRISSDAARRDRRFWDEEIKRRFIFSFTERNENAKTSVTSKPRLPFHFDDSLRGARHATNDRELWSRSGARTEGRNTSARTATRVPTGR